MKDGHTMFGFVEEVVVQMLQPEWGVVRGKIADTHGEEVHMEESDLRPSIEGGNEPEVCILKTCQP